MLSFQRLLSALAGVAILLSISTLSNISGVSAKRMSMSEKEIFERQRNALHGYQSHKQAAAKTAANDKAPPIKFKSPKASKFYVNGSAIPEVNFDVGPSYAGLLPISGNKTEERKLFFWLFPPAQGGSNDDLIIWLNGGPGCSSLIGLLQENGPFLWAPGTERPVPNPYSWTNLSSVLWIEQPVGTGYSQGTPNIKGEEDLAVQFVGFLQQFLDVFPELAKKKLYIAGESYAGTYVPFIANHIYEHPKAIDLNLQGIWLANPTIADFSLLQQVPALDFVKKFSNVLALNQTFIAELQIVADKCDYTGYTEKYGTYPPKGPFPPSPEWDDACDIWSMIYDAAERVNPAFNVYRVTDGYPLPWDTLNDGTEPTYFNRTDVKKAINAPLDSNWEKCAFYTPVFPDGDDYPGPPILTVLPNVIEKSKRTVIAHGTEDLLLLSAGSRLGIQNMTWSGLQGFQTPIVQESFIVDNIGALGSVHEERGLVFYEIELSGHQVPMFVPGPAFQTMQYLMGFRSTP